VASEEARTPVAMSRYQSAPLTTAVRVGVRGRPTSGPAEAGAVDSGEVGQHLDPAFEAKCWMTDLHCTYTHLRCDIYDGKG
jgi:hypothetical protein